MKIDKLSQLFSSAAQNNTTKTNRAQQQASDSAKADSEAVHVDGFGDESSSDRAGRVAALKQQVEAGTYRPDTQAVAEAVARDLLG
jgi:anti-sigma28 factor (negative regulator of flagellin synthesis)